VLPVTDRSDRPEAPMVTLDKPGEPGEPGEPDGPHAAPTPAAATPLVPTGDAPQSSPRRRRFFRRRHPLIHLLQALVLAILIFIGVIGYSVGGALTREGNDSVSQRLAEWGRDHHLGSVITWLEKETYTPPKKGGVASIPTIAPAAKPTAKPVPTIAHSSLPESPVLLAGAPLTNEGKWQTVVESKGYPAVQLTYVRPDAVHTSYAAAMMWLDPKLLSGRLHEGIASGDPGGTWSTPPLITPELAKTVAAAFPGGFRTTPGSAVGSRGGYYDDGRTAVPLREGAASLVIYQNGDATVGQWGRDVTMTSKIKSVRQNLDLLVDGGAVNPTCSSDSSPIWGYTVGNDAFVPRTALGVRKDGTLIFINSPAVSVCSLGQLLKSAGVQRGMELDINHDWSIGYYFTHVGGAAQGHVSRPDQAAGPDHYFSPQSRDFVAFYLRP
jgi:Phosphodiester glycosidase